MFVKHPNKGNITIRSPWLRQQMQLSPTVGEAKFFEADMADSDAVK
jgi:hypothetical protein